MARFTKSGSVSLAGLAVVLALVGSGSDAEERTSGPAAVAQQGSPQPVSLPAPQYKPPLRGAPGGRVGGGTRGGEADLPSPSVLAPEHVGLTGEEQPSLYWFLPKSTSLLVEVTVIEAQAIKPLLEMRLAAPLTPGVHRLRLGDHGVRLVPGVQYQWFVALVRDPDYRSKDILAGGGIERIELPEALRTRLLRAGKIELPNLYAEAGIWYDAVAAISDLIESRPDDPVLRGQRAALLDQVGLQEVAGYERQRTPVRTR